MAVVEFPNASVRVNRRSNRERSYRSLRACLVYILDDVRAMGLAETAAMLEQAVERADQEFALR